MFCVVGLQILVIIIKYFWVVLYVSKLNRSFFLVFGLIKAYQSFADLVAAR